MMTKTSYLYDKIPGFSRYFCLKCLIQGFPGKVATLLCREGNKRNVNVYDQNLWEETMW